MGKLRGKSSAGRRGTPRILKITALTLLAVTFAALFGGCTTTPASTSTCYKKYDALKGETVKSVARKFGISEEELKRANHMSAGYTLRAGERIFLPCYAEEVKRTAPVSVANKVRVQGAREKAGTTPPQIKTNPPVARESSPDTAAPPKSTYQATTKKPAPPKVKVETKVQKTPAKEVKPAPEVKKAAGALKFGWPVRGEVIRDFSGKSDDGTNGIDIKASTGTTVTASETGSVEYAGTPADAYGPMVLLSHGDGYYTVYTRLGDLVVSTGDKVVKGRKIATAGGENYIHFEVRYGADPLNPLLYLPRR